jgi:hypothetical protein
LKSPSLNDFEAKSRRRSFRRVIAGSGREEGIKVYDTTGI